MQHVPREAVRSAGAVTDPWAGAGRTLEMTRYVGVPSFGYGCPALTGASTAAPCRGDRVAVRAPARDGGHAS